MRLNPGHFTLKTAADLLGKLKRDRDAMVANPSDSDRCFNFFVTAEHMPEWHFGGDQKRAAKLRESSALLRVCSHLANGAKHFEATASRHTSVVGTNTTTVFRLDSSPAEGGPRPAVMEQSQFCVHLDDREAKELGAFEFPVTWLAARIEEFWTKELGHEP